MPSVYHRVLVPCLAGAMVALLAGCGQKVNRILGQEYKRTFSDLEDVRLEGQAFHVVSMRADCHVNDSPFAHSVQTVVEQATLYYARFEVRAGAGTGQAVAVATECRPLLTLPDEKLPFGEVFLSGESPRVVRARTGALLATGTASPQWQPFVARGAAAKFSDELRLRNRSGTRAFSDGLISLDGEKAEYTVGTNFLTPGDRASMKRSWESGRACLTESGEELVYQPSGKPSEAGDNEFVVVNRDGTHQTLKSSVDGVLMAAERVEGALVLILSGWKTPGVNVWNSETGQVWHHPITDGIFKAWDPRTGEVLMSEDLPFMPHATKSAFVLWHYQTSNEERGWIEWPTKMIAP